MKEALPIFSAILLAFAGTSTAISKEGLKSIAEDAELNFTQVAAKYGYPAELHTVVTDDEYVLTVHRIPYGKTCGPANNKVPVLLQHGLFSSSIDFVISGPGNSLAYLLAEECYDVWLSNSRGNRYSRGHLSMSVKDKKFWDFSWHELGVNDLPAVIDYILENTKQKGLHYIGHSQGTTQFLAFASLAPDYHGKIRSAHSLAPVSYMKNAQHPIIRILSVLHKPIFDILNTFGSNDLLPSCEDFKLFAREICCTDIPEYKNICHNIVYLFTGSIMNMTLLPAVLGHFPAGASARQLVHYAQIFLGDKFRQYDHGLLGNLARYGSIEPPIYEIPKIKVPMALYYSDNDWFANVIDVHRMAELLPNLVEKFHIPEEKFGHADFLFGPNVSSIVYEKLISVMKKY